MTIVHQSASQRHTCIQSTFGSQPRLAGCPLVFILYCKYVKKLEEAQFKQIVTMHRDLNAHTN